MRSAALIMMVRGEPQGIPLTRPSRRGRSFGGIPELLLSSADTMREYPDGNADNGHFLFCEKLIVLISLKSEQKHNQIILRSIDE
jgi:hypothetical protein